MQDNSINKLLNLKEVFVKKIVATENSIKIFVKTQPHECTCPTCGNKTSKVHDYRNQVIKDIPYMFQSTYIILKKRRYACKCGNPTTFYLVITV